jgi:hypothetical protein
MSELPPTFGYMANASTVLGEELVPLVNSPSPRSRADFIQALRLLAAELASQGCSSLPPNEEVCHVWRVFASCPYTTWRRIFGEPKAVKHYRHREMNRSFEVWEHRCSDGRVKCVGHLFERPPRERWVVVARICFA